MRTSLNNHSTTDKLTPHFTSEPATHAGTVPAGATRFAIGDHGRTILWTEFKGADYPPADFTADFVYFQKGTKIEPFTWVDNPRIANQRAELARLNAQVKTEQDLRRRLAVSLIHALECLSEAEGFFRFKPDYRYHPGSTYGKAQQALAESRALDAPKSTAGGFGT